MAFEHLIVKMFLFRSALIMGGNFSIIDYLIRNETPIRLGAIIGCVAFTGLILYSTHARTGVLRARVAIAE